MAIEAYFEGAIGLAISSVSDESDGDPDGIHTTPNWPSIPATDVSKRITAYTTDDDFIDVEVFYDPRAP